MENDGVPNGPAAPAPTQGTPVVREQDRLMPIANVIRIMRRALPAHAKISDDAKEAIQECVSEFISFVTGEAIERCPMQHRKTVNAEDIVWALNRLGFDDYVVPLSVFLHRMRDPEAGTGGAAAGDSRAVTSAPPRAAPPVIHAVPLQAQRPMYAPPSPVQVQNQVQRPVYAPPAPVQVQMQRGIYGPRAPVHGYAVGMAPVRANVGGQYQVFGGERVMAQQYYGYGYEEGAYDAGSSNGGAAIGDEESSSNGVPAPGEGTGEPELEPAAEESHDKPVQSG
ncbi:nuclear transcription factor Y subunit B-8-like [Triticum dicoccoides]|uniref:nuclear transcription factor Y subunit B-8-like n=1 Tax=Triticum dicoccoides TaxID=85692 RepID=UPI001891C256|nr:nuclear transcription factor Y subunit B-8-like [Triticum dicoccoides]